jgi:SAM-dependent methyltransferase
VSVACGVTHSAAAAAFDRVASSYDDLFTNTAIGSAQRRQVWSRLLAAFPAGSRILELNCGTGEDARFLARHGRSVLACDASPRMIQVAEAKGATPMEAAIVNYMCVANEELGLLAGEAPFDGAFSNFSGFNCVADLRAVASNLAGLVKPAGRVLLCIWSRLCLAEMLWYFLHRQTKKAFRRLREKSTAKLDGITMEVFYPTARRVAADFAPSFQLVSHRAIGLFVPPSYVESWISKRAALLTRLESIDAVCAAWPILRRLGDHVLLEFERCNP